MDNLDPKVWVDEALRVIRLVPHGDDILLALVLIGVAGVLVRWVVVPLRQK